MAVRKRSQDNTNHRLHYHSEFTPPQERGLIFPVMTEQGPLVENYLEQAYNVFHKAMAAHSRVLAVRFDLHLPHGVALPEDAESNQVIRRFLASLSSKIRANLKRKESPHRCPVRHIVAREVGPRNKRVHFHVMLLLNGHAYRQLGTMASEAPNLFWMIAEAWASALKLDVADTVNSIQCGFERGPVIYYLDPIEDYEKLPEAFRRVSYLCKAQTKHFGQHRHGLMTSRH